MKINYGAYTSTFMTLSISVGLARGGWPEVTCLIFVNTFVILEAKSCCYNTVQIPNKQFKVIKYWKWFFN